MQAQSQLSLVIWVKESTRIEEPSAIFGLVHQDRVLRKVLEDCFVEPNYLEVDVDAIAGKFFSDSTM